MSDYNEEVRVLFEILPEYNFSKEDLQYLANSGSHPVWGKMNDLVGNAERVEEFQRELDSFYNEKSNLEFDLRRFYESEGEPKNPDEKLMVIVSQRGRAWRITNKAILNGQERIKDKIEKCRKEMERFQAYMIKRFLM